MFHVGEQLCDVQRLLFEVKIRVHPIETHS